MAKGQVTDHELALGLKNFGGFGSLGGQTTKPRREDPFRDTREEAPAPVAAAPQATQPQAVQPQVSQAVRGETPRLEIVKTQEPEPVEAKAPSLPAEQIQPSPLKLREKKARIATPAAKSERVVRPVKQVPSESVAAEKKSELYTERVTVPLDAELRDGAESLAKDLQRKRTEKGERITANTVMRVALRVMLDEFDPSAADGVNTEEELYQAVAVRSPK